MINSFKHKGLKDFYKTESKSKIITKHAKKVQLLLLQLASAIKAEDMNTPGNFFHKLSGNFQDFYSVKVSANWRLIFQFEGEDAVLIDYIDYH